MIMSIRGSAGEKPLEKIRTEQEMCLV